MTDPPVQETQIRQAFAPSDEEAQESKEPQLLCFTTPGSLIHTWLLTSHANKLELALFLGSLGTNTKISNTGVPNGLSHLNPQLLFP